MKKIHTHYFLFLLTLFCSCTSSKKITNPTVNDISSIRLIGSYIIPYNYKFNNTTVGGLSGIDYDKKNDIYYFISDDRSAVNPARFYAAKIAITEKGIDTVMFKEVQSLLQPNGKPYPNSKQNPQNTPDPEAIRYYPKTQQLIWTSEGERIIKGKDTVLENPSIISISTKGDFIDSFPLPSNLWMHATEKGPRQNGVLEGLTFADNYKTLFVNVEEPLYEDGPRADLTENNAFIRIFKLDVATKQNLAQYAYKLDPIAHPSNPADKFKINGIPDILWLGNNKLLVIERSYSTGVLACTIKVFIADLNEATDIKNTASLSKTTAFKPATKKLLLNMDNLGIYTDNVEGVTLGPTLPNGHKTLLFIADDNFSVAEISQVLLFEIVE
jgi:hypothetical protein